MNFTIHRDYMAPNYKVTMLKTNIFKDDELVF